MTTRSAEGSPARGAARSGGPGSLVLGAADAERLRIDSVAIPELVLSGQGLRNLELLGLGLLVPLRTFMTRNQALATIQGRPRDGGAAFPAPVVLATLTPPEPGQTVALRDAEGDLLAVLTVTECFEIPGVSGTCVTGDLSIVQLPVHYDFAEMRMPALAPTPLPPIVLTDRPLDTGQLAGSGPFQVLAVQGDPRRDRVDHVTLVRSAAAAGAATVTLIPRPPGPDLGSWAPLLSQVMGTQVHPIQGAPPALADTDLAQMLAKGVAPVQPVVTPAVARVLDARYPPPSLVGFTVFFTGLSGSGKSTVAGALAARLAQIGPRRLTLLDGDHVRTHLSSELGFSRSDRHLNVRRIGFVAAEATRHGGIAICAPIAPYAASRAAVEAMVSAVGRFILVHVATPLEVCEARDRKGLYAKARAGLIAEFTGISDPYEQPDDPDVVIDTTTGTPGDAAAVVEQHLRNEGLVT